MESFFTDLETRAAPTLSKLRDGDIRLTPQEKSEFGTCLSLFLTRTRAVREMVNTSVPQVVVREMKKVLETPGGVDDLIAKEGTDGIHRDSEEVQSALQAVVDGNLTVEQTSKAWAIKQGLDLALRISPIIERMRWNLLEAPDLSAFITCDNPVLIFDPLGRILGPEGYDPSDQIFLQFPVSPKYMLVGELSRRTEGVHKISRDALGSFCLNQITRAHREVYASFRSDALQAQVDELSQKPEGRGGGPQS